MSNSNYLAKAKLAIFYYHFMTLSNQASSKKILIPIPPQKNKLFIFPNKKEMEISLAKSWKSTTSDDLNTKLIQQNQEILERFHQEEERCRELEESNERLREQKEKAAKKILKLKIQLQTANRNKGNGDEEANEKLEQLRHENQDLEEKLEHLTDENEKIQIACDTYERKLNELIDKHNDDVEQYEAQMEALRDELHRAEVDRKQKAEGMRRLMDSSVGESAEFEKIKDSLMKKNQMETMNQTLKAENQALKVELLKSKQKNMILLNKYSLVKKRLKRQG